MTDSSRTRSTQIQGVEVRISVRASGARYHCSVDELESGATVARGSGATPDEAEAKGLDAANLVLGLREVTSAMRAATSKLKRAI